MAISKPRRPLYILLVTLIMAGLFTGCASPVIGEVQPGGPSRVITLDGTEYRLPDALFGDAPTAEPPSTETPAPSQPTTASNQPVQPKVWLHPVLPQAFVDQLEMPDGWQKINEIASANIFIGWPEQDINFIGYDSQSTFWTYALVTPFPSTIDDVNEKTIQQAWAGRVSNAPGRQPLIMSSETKVLLDQMWGDASPKGVKIVDETKLLETAWEETDTWAIIPFEQIEPRWKVLRVDGQSPLDKAFDPAGYPLSVPIHVTGLKETQGFIGHFGLLPTNRDSKKLTTLVMTGVTALSRHIAEQMESQGVTYPATKIRDWLAGADLTHVSNEVSFYADCPKPGPERADMRFCSHPKYIELLEYIGADVIELTGNHNLDWGPQPYLDSLALYRERGWGIYGGGANLTEARTPLYIEHNGNRLVFLGCSPAGPEKVWATAYMPGSAPCDLYKLEAQIRQLRGQGYLPVVTLQAVETDVYLPPTAQGAPDFRRLAKSGAVIVSGSQSHVPQTMTFVPAETGGDSFVHYGLGNLFFDQVKPKESRQQFIDRHIFYDGRYLGVELLTAVLEDSLRPRPMTRTEREEFLQTLFSLSQWDGN